MKYFNGKQVSWAIFAIALVSGAAVGVWLQFSHHNLFLVPTPNSAQSSTEGRYTLGEERPTKIATVESPISESTAAWNDRYLAIALFEQLSSEVEIAVIDRKAVTVKPIRVPSSYVVYSMFFDRQNQDVLWVATSQRAALWRVDLTKNEVTLFADVGPTQFLFASEQHPSGDIYLGVYPDGQLLRVSQQERGKAEKIEIDEQLIGTRTNVKDIFIPDNGIVYVHVGSPGLLLAYDPKSGKVAEILRTEDPFLFPIRDIPSAVEKISSPSDFALQPLRPDHTALEKVPAWAARMLPKAVYHVERKQFELIVHHDGRETILSARPRHRGMPIVAFNRVGSDLAVGATYWNRWFFKFDLSTGEVTPLGPIGRSGEFFTACSLGTEVAIPHYLGLLLRWNPNSPVVEPRVVNNPADPHEIAAGKDDNPREILMLPDGHLGLSCVETKAGQLVYAMLPNYSQKTGSLVLVAAPSGADKAVVLARSNPEQTFSRLAVHGNRLFAGTSEFRGLGVRRTETPRRPRVVELDPASLNEIRSVELAVDRSRNTTAIISLDDKRLLVGIEGGGIFVVDVDLSSFVARKIGEQCLGVSSMVALRPGFAVVLCGDRLYAVNGESEAISLVTTAPPTSGFLVSSSKGEVFIASYSEIHRVSAESIDKAIQAGGSIVSLGELISDGEYQSYKTENIRLRDEASWISPLSGAAALRSAFIGTALDKPEEIVSAIITWVLPANTPAQVRIECSDDGKDWHLAAIRATSMPSGNKPYWTQELSWPPFGRYRYWRVVPDGSLSQQFAMESLEFHRR